MTVALQLGLGELFTNVQLEPIVLKDFLLGFFIALALRRGRIALLLDRALPGDDPDSKDVEVDADDSES